MCFLIGFFGGMCGMGFVFFGLTFRDIHLARIRTIPNVLRLIEEVGGTISAIELYRMIDGNMEVIERLVAKGFISPDRIPPRNFELTDAGRKHILTYVAV